MTIRKSLVLISLSGLALSQTLLAQQTLDTRTAATGAEAGAQLAPGVSIGNGHATGKANAPATCALSASPRAFDTALQWYLPDDAVKLAKHENKLLMVLHISGNFEKQAFT